MKYRFVTLVILALPALPLGCNLFTPVRSSELTPSTRRDSGVEDLVGQDLVPMDHSSSGDASGQDGWQADTAGDAATADSTAGDSMRPDAEPDSAWPTQGLVLEVEWQDSVDVDLAFYPGSICSDQAITWTNPTPNWPGDEDPFLENDERAGPAYERIVWPVPVDGHYIVRVNPLSTTVTVELRVIQNDQLLSTTTETINAGSIDLMQTLTVNNGIALPDEAALTGLPDCQEATECSTQGECEVDQLCGPLGICITDPNYVGPPLCRNGQTVVVNEGYNSGSINLAYNPTRDEVATVFRHSVEEGPRSYHISRRHPDGTAAAPTVLIDELTQHHGTERGDIAYLPTADLYMVAWYEALTDQPGQIWAQFFDPENNALQGQKILVTAQPALIVFNDIQLEAGSDEVAVLWIEGALNAAETVKLRRIPLTGSPPPEVVISPPDRHSSEYRMRYNAALDEYWVLDGYQTIRLAHGKTSFTNTELVTLDENTYGLDMAPSATGTWIFACQFKSIEAVHVDNNLTVGQVQEIFVSDQDFGEGHSMVQMGYLTVVPYPGGYVTFFKEDLVEGGRRAVVQLFDHNMTKLTAGSILDQSGGYLQDFDLVARAGGAIAGWSGPFFTENVPVQIRQFCP